MSAAAGPTIAAAASARDNPIQGSPARAGLFLSPHSIEKEFFMRTLIAAALLTAVSGAALAQSQEFYVVQNTETEICAITSEYPEDGANRVVIANKFSDRADAELAMQTLRSCS
jgi:hypothetical protein